MKNKESEVLFKNKLGTMKINRVEPKSRKKNKKIRIVDHWRQLEWIIKYLEIYKEMKADKS